MKIHNKLFIILFGFSFVLVFAIAAFMQWSIDKGMVEYVNKREIKTLSPVVAQLADIYLQQDNWDVLYDNNRRFRRLLRQGLMNSDFTVDGADAPPPRPRFDERRPPRHQGGFIAEKSPPHFQAKKPPRRREFDKAPANPNRAEVDNRPPRINPQVSYALLNLQKSLIVGDYPVDREYSFTEITANNKVVGYFAISKRNRLTAGYELDFLEQQKNYLWLISLVIMLFVVLITLPLSRHFLSPIRSLAKGMHQLAQGKYDSKLSIERKDEFAGLSRDFNELAKTLLENDSARKRWLANISHELRTPVAILKGELEAIIDGVRALSIEQVNSAHQEVMHLERLISDLHALTSADIGGMSYRKAPVDLIEFIKQESTKYQSFLFAANFALETNYKANKLEVFADKTRLCQLFDNLINNCIKYAQTGTKLKLTLEQDLANNCAVIVFEDDGIGVEEKHLAHLFEHLYRVDDSRNRKTGGTGLGLSICAHIVAGHQGEISAEHSSMGGLAIIISLPL